MRRSLIMNNPYMTKEEKHELERLLLFKDCIKDTLICWRGTRLKSISASLICDGNVCEPLLEAFDEVQKEIKNLKHQEPDVDSEKPPSSESSAPNQGEVDQACENCQWWETYTDGKGERLYGVCRRFPPSASYTGAALNLSTVWPRPLAGDWCGEHKWIEQNEKEIRNNEAK